MQIICRSSIDMVYFLHMKPRLTTSQIQKQILAPSMQQSIEVLMLPTLELNLAIQQELEKNPFLELVEPENAENESAEDLLRQEERLQETMDIPYRHEDGKSGDSLEDKTLRRMETLEESLLHQLRCEINDPLRLEIGLFIIGNLNEDGYLKISCEEMTDLIPAADSRAIRDVLTIIQDFEPAGIAAQDLKECLLIQLSQARHLESNLAVRIVQECLPDLGKKNYIGIARRLSAGTDEVRQAARLIAGLDPRPARNYRPLQPNIYIKPDVTIIEQEETYQIVLNDQDIPPLRVNTFYKTALKGKKLNRDEREFVREKLKNAIQFIRSVRQRGQTLKDIAGIIARRQKEFFAKGHLALVPMRLKDIARELDRNESTISRAIQNKYIDTPQGPYPIKFFFSQAVGQDSLAQGGFSNRSVKEEIRRMIDEEDKNRPLSDQAIQKILLNNGMAVARRTVSKYRQALKILPRHLRKR